MYKRFLFHSDVLQSVVGGKSSLELNRLSIRNLAEAEAFIQAYGFNVKDPVEEENLWYYYRRSIVFMIEKLGFPMDAIPQDLRDRKNLKDLRQILIWASQDPHGSTSELQKWSCALLRVMHVFIHAENDLFASFAEEIQKQILTPFQKCLHSDEKTGRSYLAPELRPSKEAESTEKKGQMGQMGQMGQIEQMGQSEKIELIGFEIKPFKTSTSTVIKLLAKSDVLAMNVFDKLGVRFITRSLLDSFRVVRFLVEENIFSFPHIMPEQSSNNLYPVELFLHICQKLENETNRNWSDEDIQNLFIKELEKNKDHVQFLRKQNLFSGQDYRFIKFISRKYITIRNDSREDSFSFFFPFEVQIMDQNSHQKIMSGPSHHMAYKERQKEAARRRVMPSLFIEPEKGPEKL